MQNLKPKYNLLTAICLVVGIVIGTGVFFKAGSVLNEVNGNLKLSTFAWIIGGLIMIVSCYNFSTLSLNRNNSHTLVDFAKNTVHHKFGYYVGVFAKYIYFPSMTATVAFVCGMYSVELLNIKSATFPFSLEVFLFASGYLIFFFLLNVFAPIISGKFQVTTTAIKLIPLALMAIIGLIVGFMNDTLINNFKTTEVVSSGKGLFAAICVTAFSYEGWICATNISFEIKNKEKNLAKALTIGTFIVMIIYLVYNLGLSGVLTNSELVNNNASEAVKLAFVKLFGNGVSIILILIVTISGMGTLNGLTLANSRSAYILASMNEGLFQDTFKKVYTKTNIPLNSSIFGLIMAGLWLIYYYFSQTNELSAGIGFPFSSDELPIITTYLIYIPIFIGLMIKGNGLNIFKRYIMPSLGIISSLFMITASIYRHQINTLYYLIFVAVLMAIAFLIDFIRHYHKDVLSK